MLGDDRDVRVARVRQFLAHRAFQEIQTAAFWPFQREVLPVRTELDVIWIRDLHLAFPAGQTSGTRLVLTQSTYQLQRWLDWLDRNRGITVIADAQRTALRQSSPEAFTGRGPWRHIEIVDAGEDMAADQTTPRAGGLHEGSNALHAAFMQGDPSQRMDVCRHAADVDADNAALQLAFASTCMEFQLLDDAEAALARATALAPDWEAVHFERGKLLLRREDTEGAAAAFTEAVRLMPGFAAALLNLGAALGELGRRAEARGVLERALQADPRSHTALNNLGAVYREEGRLDEAAEAFRGVVALAPAFVFGYYNLGQTLLLKGDVARARGAYEEGFERDPQKNPRQACRLAVARAADGDGSGARHLIEIVAEGLAPDRRIDIFAEAESMLDALSARSGGNGDAVNRLRALLRSYSS